MLTILCVDDDPRDLCLVTALFQMRGYGVLATSDPHQAMDLAKSVLFELAVLDYNLPRMSGTALARELKRIRPNVPIVLFSGALSIAAEELTAIDEHVQKGESPDALLLKTRHLLKPRATSMHMGSHSPD